MKPYFVNFSEAEQLVLREAHLSTRGKCLFRMEIILERYMKDGDRKGAINDAVWAITRMVRDTPGTYDIARIWDKLVAGRAEPQDGEPDMAHSESESPIPNPVKTD